MVRIHTFPFHGVGKVPLFDEVVRIAHRMKSRLVIEVVSVVVLLTVATAITLAIDKTNRVPVVYRTFDGEVLKVLNEGRPVTDPAKVQSILQDCFDVILVK